MTSAPPRAGAGDPLPRAASTVRRLLAALHGGSLIAFASLVFLARDEPFAWRWWATVVLFVGCGAAVGRQLVARAQLAPEMRDAPYLAYALAWLLAYWAHPSSAGWHALIDQGVFLAAIVLAARVDHPGWLLALLISILCLIGLQVFGPVSVVVGSGRAMHYKSLDQWGGYPEIGMLVGLGASACVAVAFATRRAALAAAASLLAGGLAYTPIYMVSRSAVLTIGIVAGWLAIVAAIRWRARLALAVLAVAAVGGLAIAILGGSLVWNRVAAAMLVRGGEADARAEGWRVAIAMMRDFPWLGVGPGRYPTVYGTYSALADPTHAYNMPLHIGAELGVVGLIAWLWFWARPLIATWRASARTQAGAVAFAAHAMLLAFLLRSQSEHFLANLPTSFRMLLVLGLLFGLAEAAARAVPRDTRRRERAHRASGLRGGTSG